MLRTLLEDINKLNLKPSVIGDEDIIGNAYQYMIEQFASDAGKKGGEFYTPTMASELLARLVKPEENDRISSTRWETSSYFIWRGWPLLFSSPLSERGHMRESIGLCA